MKYRVKITAPETIWNETTVEVDANTEDEAKAKALSRAKDWDNPLDWWDNGNWDGTDIDDPRVQLEVEK